ncbi:MAG: ubiquinol-cytochrome C chaperone family protein [Caulobacterales bacterium]
MSWLDAWLPQGQSEADAVVAAVSQAARQPALFADGAMPDTMDGRLEMLTLIASLALIRLEAEQNARRKAQRFADTLFRHIDAGLREAGVGDLSVPKRMRALAGRFYGRVNAYSAAVKAGDENALADAIARNTPAGAFAPQLARHALNVHSALAACPAGALADAEAWPQPAA